MPSVRGSGRPATHGQAAARDSQPAASIGGNCSEPWTPAAPRWERVGGPGLLRDGALGGPGPSVAFPREVPGPCAQGLFSLQALNSVLSFSLPQSCDPAPPPAPFPLTLAGHFLERRGQGGWTRGCLWASDGLPCAWSGIWHSGSSGRYQV